MTTPLPAPDMPDDYDWNPGSVRSPIGDLGELAARLGSVELFDRRGEVIWYDKCDRGLSPVQVSLGSANSIVRVVDTSSYLSPYALQLYAAGEDDGDAQVFRTFALTEASRYGYEIGIILFTPAEWIFISGHRTIGGVKHAGALYINNDTFDLSVLTPDGYKVFANYGYDLATGGGQLHIIKIVFDYETYRYVRLIFDDTEYNLSMYELTSTGGQVYQYNEFNVDCQSNWTDPTTAHLTYQIITANEP